jgi:hypothetical protein
MVAMCCFLMNQTDMKGHAVETAKIKSVIEAFVKSGDKQSPSLAKESMHQTFTQYLDFMGKGIGQSDLKLYLQMIESKKIGGEEREYAIEHLDVAGSIAFAKVVITSKTLVFTDYVTLMKDATTDWKIVSITMAVTPVK